MDHSPLWTRAIGVAGLAVGLLGACEPAPTMGQGAPPPSGAHESLDGLRSTTFLTQFGDLSHGLSTTVGLPATSGPMTSDNGREQIGYLVRCALPAGDSLVKADQEGTIYTFPGELGLAPQFKDGACDGSCQELLTACVLAHVNTGGINVPVWLASAAQGIGWSTSPAYPIEDATFFGNLWSGGDSGSAAAYYCAGGGAGTDAVPGRVGGTREEFAPIAPYSSADSVAPGTCGSCAASGAWALGSCKVGDQTFASPMTAWRSRAYFATGATYVGSSVVKVCDSCQPRLGYFTPGATVTFHGVASTSSGPGRLRVYFVDGDAPNLTRSFDVAVNGVAAGTMTFSGIVGDWGTIQSAAVTAGAFVAGADNSVTFSVGAGASAPDLVWIEVLPAPAP